MDTMSRARDAVARFLHNTALRTPARLALMVFGLVILLFSGLLSLPWATTTGQRAPYIDALFTSTSAVTVTGLSTVDTGNYWSAWGLAVIAMAMKVGGLGIMTLASLFGLLVSRRIGVTQRLLAAGEARAAGLGDVKVLVLTIVVLSTSVEAILALVLLPSFLDLGYGFGRSFGYSGFYAISAFNNAGFNPDPGGITTFSGNWWVLAPIALGVFIGALGFPVYLNLLRHWRDPKRWTLHTKITLVMVVGLTVVSTLALAVFEWSNPRTLGGHGTSETIANVVFQSVNLRSGGFGMIDSSQMNGHTLLMEDVMMFIGGGSGSTAGGIRVTTLAGLLLAIVAEARGRRDIEAFGRRIGTLVLRVAVSVVLVSLTVVIVGTGIFMAQTGLSLDRALYEVVSAFATCGLTTGVTASLGDNHGAKITLMVIMFVGRVGTLTIAGALTLNAQRRVIRYPAERVLIG